jgi:hypothetical protein
MTRESPPEPTREELIALIAGLRAENAALEARIAELERRLGLNSANSPAATTFETSFSSTATSTFNLATYLALY